MARKPNRPSLLDIQLRHGPTERRRLNWMLWQRPLYEELVRQFKATYGEGPVFWKRFVNRQIDLFLTHPENALAVHRQDGHLVRDSRLHRLAWGARIDSLSTERRRHIPPQVADVLDGELAASEWEPEIMQRFFHNREREQELVELLRGNGLGSCLEIERHKGIIRVFGAPEKVDHVFRLGVERGLLKLEKR